MIYFLTTERNMFPMRRFLRSGGKVLADQIVLLPYTRIHELSNMERGNIVFSDHDLLGENQRLIQKEIYNTIRTQNEDLKLLNDPSRVLLRKPMLRNLSEVNGFNCYSFGDNLEEARFPVFVREENRHTGPLTNLIYNPDGLMRNLDRLIRIGYSSRELLIVEYSESVNQRGEFVKYSAFHLLGEVFPRYLNFSHDWNVKADLPPKDPLMEARNGEIAEYMEQNPHRDWIRNIFEIAGIDYGRIDYGMVDGKCVAWEINLNPAFVDPPRDPRLDNPQQKYMRETFYAGFVPALQRLNTSYESSFSLNPDRSISAEFKLPFKRRVRERYLNRIVKDKWRWRSLRRVVMLYSWGRRLIQRRLQAVS